MSILLSLWCSSLLWSWSHFQSLILYPSCASRLSLSDIPHNGIILQRANFHKAKSLEVFFSLGKTSVDHLSSSLLSVMYFGESNLPGTLSTHNRNNACLWSRTLLILSRLSLLNPAAANICIGHWSLSLVEYGHFFVVRHHIIEHVTLLSH